MRIQPGVKQVEADVPYGVNGEPIQVLAPVEDTVAEVAIGAANAAAALPANASIVEVTASDNCRFAFGTSGVDASAGVKRILLKGCYVYRVPAGATHFAAVQFGAVTGTVTAARLR